MSVGTPPELHEGRDGERELYRLVNWLRRRTGSLVSDADFWVSSDQSSTFTNSVNIGALSSGYVKISVAAGVATPTTTATIPGDEVDIDNVTITVNGSTELQRAALTGDITAAAGSNTTAFRSFAATSVLANATAGAAVPTDLAASADGQVLNRAAGALTWSTLGSASVPALDARFWVSEANANLANEVNLGALSSGILQHTVAAGVSTPGVVTVSTGLTYSSPTLTANLSTGIAGGQSVIGGTAASENLTYSSTTNGTKGLHVWGSTTGMWYDEANVKLILGTATPFAQAAVEVVKSVNSGVGFTFVNTSAGGSAYTAFFLAQNATLSSGATFGTYLFSSGSTFGLPYGVNVGLFELAGGAGNMHFWIQQNTGDFVWYTRTTFPNPPERMRVSNLGNVVIGTGLLTTATDGFLYLPSSNGVPSGVPTTYSASAVIPIEIDRANNRLYAYLAPWVPIGQYTGGLATGLLKNTNGTGIWSIGVAGTDYQAPITWPSGNRVVYTTSASGPPVGSDGVLVDPSDDSLFISSAGVQKWRNLGAIGATNYEQVRAFWSGNVFVLGTEAGGTGTERNMLIGNATTATVTVSSGGGVTIVGGASAASAPAVTAANLQLALTSVSTRASSGSAVLDAITFDATTITVTGNTNITTATGYNYIVVDRPTYSGGGVAKTVTSAATMMIEGAPIASSSLSITVPYALWVQSGLVEFSGDLILCGSGQALGFFGSTGAAKQTPAGSRGGNAALASLLTALASYGLITDGTSA